MAVHANSTTAPVVQTGLLPFVFRPVPPVDDTRNAVELLDEIVSIIEGQKVSVQSAPKSELLPEPLFLAFHGDTRTDIGSTDRCSSATNYPDQIGVVEDRPDDVRLADHARTLYLRRQLAEAAENGVALLDALGLPRLVTAEFEPIDREAVADALDVVISHLDAVDGDTDIEDGADNELTGDDELTLGWTNIVRQTDLGWSYDDAEPSLGAPERHPSVTWMIGDRYTDRSANCRQTAWADGGQQDLEGEITDEPHDDDGEDLEPDDDKEPVLGATEQVDQTTWAESGTCDREFDATDCIDRHKPVAQWEASIARRGDMVALTRRAGALRRIARGQIREERPDPDTLIPLSPGMMWWGGPAHV